MNISMQIGDLEIERGRFEPHSTEGRKKHERPAHRTSEAINLIERRNALRKATQEARIRSERKAFEEHPSLHLVGEENSERAAAPHITEYPEDEPSTVILEEPSQEQGLRVNEKTISRELHAYLQEPSVEETSEDLRRIDTLSSQEIWNIYTQAWQKFDRLFRLLKQDNCLIYTDRKYSELRETSSAQFMDETLHELITNRYGDTITRDEIVSRVVHAYENLFELHKAFEKKKAEEIGRQTRQENATA